MAVECNAFAAQTIRKNRPDVHLFEKRLEEVPTAELLKAAGLSIGEVALVTAGPSCQSFSTAGGRGSIEDPRGTMFREFIRVVREAKPRFFVMENVTGVLSAAIKHRPLALRGPGHPPLQPDEELGSAFALILKELASTGYHIVFDVLNAADFGVPQTRRRVVFIGSRDGEPLRGPTPTHHEHGRPTWVALRAALRNLHDPKPAHSTLPRKKRKYLAYVPPGGNWRDLPTRQQRAALGAAYVSWGGRVGFLRRLSWERPAPALTTRPDSSATMLCHPDQLRPLSVREYARLQQYPAHWEFVGGLPQKYQQLGNAVPLGLGEAIGLAIRTTMRARSRQPVPKRKVVCLSTDVYRRLVERPHTVLNPKRMRKVKGAKATKKWLMNGNGGNRSFLTKYLVTLTPESARSGSRPTTRSSRRKPS